MVKNIKKERTAVISSCKLLSWWAFSCDFQHIAWLFLRHWFCNLRLASPNTEFPAEVNPKVSTRDAVSVASSLKGKHLVPL